MVIEALPTKETAVLKGHEGAVLAVRFNFDGNYCLTCGKDRAILLWNPHKGILIKTYNGHGREVRDVAASSDNSRLASCGADRQIFMWDVAQGRTVRRFRGHDSDANVVKFSPTDSVVVSGGYDRSVRCWDARSHSIDPIQVMSPFGDSVTSAVVTAHEIVAGSVDGTVRTFDIRMGRVLTDHIDGALKPAVTSVALSRDGNCILVSCLGSKLQLLDRATGEVLNEYKGHLNKSYKVDSCLSNTDAHVVSGSEDGRVCFWDLVEASPMLDSFQAHSAVVTGVAYHKTEVCMVTSSVDGTARVWKQP